MKAEIFPLLEARGFQRLKHSGTWYGFTRLQSDQLQIIEIQWDKYHRPRFAVNFSQTPVVMHNGETGFRNRFTGEWLPLAEVSCGQDHYNRLSVGRLRRQWFGYSWLASLRPSGGPHSAVDRCIAVLPLIDGWFAGDPSSIEIIDRMNQREASAAD